MGNAIGVPRVGGLRKRRCTVFPKRLGGQFRERCGRQFCILDSLIQSGAVGRKARERGMWQWHPVLATGAKSREPGRDRIFQRLVATPDGDAVGSQGKQTQ